MEYGEKRQQNLHAVTWPSISRDVGQAAAQNNHQGQWKDRFHAIEQEKEGVAQAESRVWSRGPTFCIIGEAQILCFAELHTGGSDGPTRDQVKATEVSKTGG